MFAFKKIEEVLIVKMTIGTKLIGWFLILALILAATSSISAYYLDKIDEEYSDLLDRRAVILKNVKNIQVEISKETSRLRGYVITEDQQFLDNLGISYDNVKRLIRETGEMTQLDQFKADLDELDKAHELFKQKYEPLLQMVQSRQPTYEITGYFQREVVSASRQLDQAG